jgi:general secretion pathway protein K
MKTSSDRNPRTPLATRTNRGSALLTVLWLSAALSAIAFSIAVTVRGETERTSTDLDGLRCGYVAAAGIERAAMELLWSATSEKKLIPPGAIFVDYVFPSGDARVFIVPEAGKLDVNHASIEDLGRLLYSLGLEPGRAAQIAAAIDEYRRPGAESAPAVQYLPGTPSFKPAHASLGEIEELLLVPGITPEIFYGGYTPGPPSAPDPETGESVAPLVRHSGLMQCLSVYGATGPVDINTADPAVLLAVGLSPAQAEAVVARRMQKPFEASSLGEFANGRLRAGGNTIVTFRSTARLRLASGQLSDLRRTVAAQVKYMPMGTLGLPYHTLRWYDTAFGD